MNTTTTRQSAPSLQILSSIAAAYYSMACQEKSYGSSTWESIDEKELADEMDAVLPVPALGSQMPDVAAEEFETAYQWFLS